MILSMSMNHKRTEVHTRRQKTDKKQSEKVFHGKVGNVDERMKRRTRRVLELCRTNIMMGRLRWSGKIHQEGCDYEEDSNRSMDRNE